MFPIQAYLRFEHDKAVGVVTSRECNVAFDETGRHLERQCVNG